MKNERALADQSRTTWAVLDDYGYTPVEVTRETASTVFYKVWNQQGTAAIERKTLSALRWRGPEADARRLSGQMKSAKAERDNRVRRANDWFRARVAELTAANPGIASHTVDGEEGL